jgi:LPS export ABC transporter protein LptC
MRTIIKTVAVAFLVAATFLFSACTNTSEDIIELSAEVEAKPLNVQKNIIYEYSDSSFKRLEVRAPEVIDYSQIEEPYREFPAGIDVTFYAKDGTPESHLTSNYAKELIAEQIWEARGDVIVLNEKGEKINTEQLFWDVRKEMIYSNVFVKIATGDEVIMGDGFEADQNFTSYKIKGNVKGEIQIEEKEDEQNGENR